MLTSKIACFVKYLTPLLMDFHETSIMRDSFDETIEMRVNNPDSYFKTISFVNYLELYVNGFYMILL